MCEMIADGTAPMRLEDDSDAPEMHENGTAVCLKEVK
jgi:hypothetical protein